MYWIQRLHITQYAAYRVDDFSGSVSALLFTQELEGPGRRGRPRKGWKEEVERDLQVLGVRRWRELVTDRKKWKDIVRQAKAHSGL